MQLLWSFTIIGTLICGFITASQRTRLQGGLVMPQAAHDIKVSRSDDVPISIPKSNFTRFINKRCSPIQQLAERVAWGEAGILLDALEQWSSKSPNEESDFQEAMNLYMGTHSGVSSEAGPWERMAMYTAIDKLRKFRDGQLANDQVYVYCDEATFPPEFFDRPECFKPFGTCCTNDINSYSWEFENANKTLHMLVLCPRFYASPSLSEQSRYLKWTESMKNDSNKMYGNAGATYFKQSFYWSSISQINVTKGQTTSNSKSKNPTVTKIRLPIAKVKSKTKFKTQAAKTMSPRPTATFDTIEERATIPQTTDAATKNDTQITINAKNNVTVSNDCVSGNPLCAIAIAATKNVASSFYNVDSWTIAAGVLYQMQALNLTTPPMPNNNAFLGQAGLGDKVSADKYSGPTSRFLGNISTPWIGLDNDAQPNRTTWVNSVDVGLYTKDYGAYQVPKGDALPTPSCIAKPYIHDSIDKDFGLDTIANKYCAWVTTAREPEADGISPLVTPETPYCPKAYPVTGKDGAKDMTLWLSASIIQHPECGGFMLIESTCKKFFGQIINGCDGDNMEDKYSGSFVNSCYVLDAQISLMQDGIPPKGKLATQKEGFYPY